ncbi:uncharacterized protein LOC141651546 [Silene latifolia]|uniref:uncharacterized protein LOC141651546 n=1 Tax=Silene latifolia TaxID=37657 RepID=UPI003D76DBC7
MKAVYKGRFRQFSLVTNYESHPGGRIWILSNPSTVQLTVLCKGTQFIHCSLLHIATQNRVLVTFIYALNRAIERIELWKTLQDLSVGKTLPWMCLGDFNVSLNSDERVGCVPHERGMQDFRDCLHYCGLSDHPYTGGLFTWHNKQMASPRISDHAPILLTIPSEGHLIKPFKYLNCWALSDGFQNLVSQYWTHGNLGGKIFSLFSKLRNMRKHFKQLDSTEFSGLTQRVTEAKSKLMDCQVALQLSPLSKPLLLQEKLPLDSYTKLKSAEIRVLFQRAKVQHLQQSDANTKYFYASIAVRNSRNTIGAITDAQGKHCLGQKEVAHAFLNYYKDLLGSTETRAAIP